MHGVVLPLFHMLSWLSCQLTTGTVFTCVCSFLKFAVKWTIFYCFINFIMNYFTLISRNLFALEIGSKCLHVNK